MGDNNTSPAEREISNKRKGTILLVSEILLHLIVGGVIILLIALL